MSNTERQREFRERHPGYYQRLHAKRKAICKMLADLRIAMHTRALPAPLALPAPVMAAEEPKILALPAPVEWPVIPGINTIAEPAREKVEVTHGER